MYYWIFQKCQFLSSLRGQTKILFPFQTFRTFTIFNRKDVWELFLKIGKTKVVDTSKNKIGRWGNHGWFCFKEGKQLAASRECKFIETSSGIQHNVDELLVGVLKQIRLRENRDKKLKRQGSKRRILSKLHGSKTALSLNLAREILNKMCLNDSKSKSCENLHVL